MASSRGPGRTGGARPSRSRPGASGASTRPASASVPRGGERPARRRPGRPHHIWRLGVLAVLLGFIALFLTPTMRGYLDQRAEINRLEQQVHQEEQAIAALEQQIADWQDPEFVERQARERLRFVRPGEVAFTVLDDTGEQLTEPVPGMAAVTADVHESRPWYGQVWESVVASTEGLDEEDGVDQP